MFVSEQKGKNFKMKNSRKKTEVDPLLSLDENPLGLSYEHHCFKSLLEIEEAGIVLLDDRFQILRFNRGAEQMFGYKREEIIGQTIDVLIPQRYQKTHQVHLEEFSFASAISQPMNKRNNIYGLRRNREEFPARAAISKIEVEGKKIFTAIIHDISEIIKKEEELSLAKKNLEIRVRERTLQLEESNQELQLTLKHEKLVGRLASLLNSTIDFPCVAHDLLKLIANTLEITEVHLYSFFSSKRSLYSSSEDLEGWFYEQWVVRTMKERKIIVLSSTKELEKEIKPEFRENMQSMCAVPVKVGKEVKGLICFSQSFEHCWSDHSIELFKTIADMIASAWGRDLQLQARLQAEKKQAEMIQVVEKTSRLASIGVMAAGITHEINQPLNAIKVTADSVLFWEKRNQGVLPELFVNKISKISTGASRIDEIIQHMRSFWVSPKESPEKIIDLEFVIKNGLTLISSQLSSHGIKPKMQAAGKNFLVRGNPLHLEQVAINLLVNAMHSIDTKSQNENEKQSKTICIKLEKQRKNVIFEVLDNGIGIPNGSEDKLYDPFFSTKKPGEGMGLGLAIVKKFIDSVGGTIDAYNNEMGGATFRVEIPMAQKT